MTDTAARVKMLIEREGGTTAAQVVVALGISRPTAYKYLKALRKTCGASIMVRRERVAAHGPKSKVYYTMKNRRPR